MTLCIVLLSQADLQAISGKKSEWALQKSAAAADSVCAGALSNGNRGRTCAGGTKLLISQTEMSVKQGR